MGGMWRGRPSSQPLLPQTLLDKGENERNNIWNLSKLPGWSNLTLQNIPPVGEPPDSIRPTFTTWGMWGSKINDEERLFEFELSSKNSPQQKEWTSGKNLHHAWGESRGSRLLFLASCKTFKCPLGVSTHVLCLQVSMASAMGSWCVTVAPLMYWVILPATSSWSKAQELEKKRKRKEWESIYFTRKTKQVEQLIPVCGGSERLNTSLHTESRKEEL